MQFDAPKAPTNKPTNSANLTGAASLAQKATPGTVAPKVAKLPKIEKAPPPVPAPQASAPLPPVPRSPLKTSLAEPPSESGPPMSMTADVSNEEATLARTPMASLASDAAHGVAPSQEGDPGIMWSAADWDMVLVLPLPEERAVAAAERDVENAGEKSKAAKKARKEASKVAEQQVRMANAPSATPRRDTEYRVIDSGEAKLRKGLQLDDDDEAADECGGSQSGTSWLIGELRRRVLMSGLECKVVKLLSAPDTQEEAVGEHEVLSKHNVTLVCIGAAKSVIQVPAAGGDGAGPSGAPALPAPRAGVPPTPPPTPPASPPDGGDKAAAAAAAAALKAEAKAAMKEGKAAKKEELRQFKEDNKEARAEADADKAQAKAEQKEAKKAAIVEEKAGIQSTKDAERARVLAAKAQMAEAQRALKDVKREAKANIKAVKSKDPKADMQRRALMDGARAGERFPRLEAEAEFRQMRLPTVGDAAGLPGPRALYRRSAYASFPAFRSMRRQSIYEAILTAPLHSGRGAGLNLDMLVASERVLEVIYVHDDDEVSELKNKLVFGSAGLRPLRPTTLEALHSYAGGEVSFYFAWVSAYTRSLHLPALLGGMLWLADAFYFDEAIALERAAAFDAVLQGAPDLVLEGGALSSAVGGNTSAAVAVGFARVAQLMAPARGAGSEIARLRAYLTAAFGLFIVVWSVGFEEAWKRRQALIGFGWGEVGGDRPPPSVNPFFAAVAVKTGFYTEDGLWVELPPSKRPPSGLTPTAAAAASSAEKMPLVGDGAAPRVKEPMDVWFPVSKRARRQWMSFLVLVAMTALCCASIFFMQVFSSYMLGVEVIISGTDYSATIVSVSKAVMITVFNTAWREIAIKLSNWENYRTSYGPSHPYLILLAVRACSSRAEPDRHRAPQVSRTRCVRTLHTSSSSSSASTATLCSSSSPSSTRRGRASLASTSDRATCAHPPARRAAPTTCAPCCTPSS